MTTTVAAVHDHLESDPGLVDSLSRGLLNLRRTARWLIEEHGWDTTEEAIVSALRRYRDEENTSPVWASRDRLQDLRLELRDGLALVTVPSLPHVRADVIDAWLTEHGAGPLGVMPGRMNSRLLVEEGTVSALSQVMPPGEVPDVQAPVAVLRLIVPTSVQATPLVTLILAALAHRGIEILEVVSCHPEWLIVVADDEILEAHRIVAALTNRPIASPGQAGA